MLLVVGQLSSCAPSLAYVPSTSEQLLSAKVNMPEEISATGHGLSTVETSRRSELRMHAATGEWDDVEPASETTHERAQHRVSQGVGDGLRARRGFDVQRGWPARIRTGMAIGRGDRATRTDLRRAGGSQTRAFTDDARDRLVGWSIAGKGDVTFTYDVIGSLTERSTTTSTGTETQTFQYTRDDASGRAVGPHALTSASFGAFAYEAAGPQSSAPGRLVDFTTTSRR